MAIPAWYWPPSGATARGNSLASFGAGMAVADWTTATLWPFALSGSALNPLPGSVLASGTPGFSSAASDGASGVWALTWTGTLFHQPPSGSATSTSMPTGAVYVGCAAPNGSGVALGGNGKVYTSGAATLGTWPTPARTMVSSGTTLAGLLPASGIGTMNASNGATGLIALSSAVTVASCIALSSGLPLGIGGWQNAPPLSGAATSALDPQDATAMMAVGSGVALLWHAPSALSDNWSQTRALTGMVNLSSMAWRPDGTQVLAASVTSGVVQVVGYSAGVMSRVQSISVSGACSVAVAGTSTNALVAQSGQAKLATLSYAASTWSVGSPVTGIANVTAVAAFGPSGAVATSSSGLIFLSLVGGAWSINTVTALPFAPSVVAVDSFLSVYAAGSGSIAVTSGSTLLGSGSWSGGTPTAIAVQQGRAILAVPTDSAYYLFGESASVPGTWTQQGSGSLALGSAVGLGLSNTTLFMSGSGATNMFGFSGTPFMPTPVLSGVASMWNGSTWTNAALGIGNLPSACAWDVSGNFRLVTSQNTTWSLTSGGVFASSGSVPQYSPQPQTTPMGPSAILSSGGHTFVSTSMAGVLVEID